MLGVAAVVAGLVVVCAGGGTMIYQGMSDSADAVVAAASADDEAVAGDAEAAAQAQADDARASAEAADAEAAEAAVAALSEEPEAPVAAEAAEERAELAPPKVEPLTDSTPYIPPVSSETRPSATASKSTPSTTGSGPSSASVRKTGPATSSRPSSTGSSTASARTSSPPDDDALADLSIGEIAPEEDILESVATNLDRYSSSAAKGNLTSSDVLTLEMVEIADPSYTRSRAMLLMNAQRKSDTRATKQYLDELMKLPENRYNPVFLTDMARYQVNRGSYKSSLDAANLAERHWARLPSELVFTKKAEIYEIQAASYQGLFYKSEDDMELLDQAIHGWQKYREHVASGSRAELTSKADAELSKLEDIRLRLQ